MASSPGRRVASYLGIAVGCVLLFLVPSTWVIARGGPAWFAAVVGLLAFPLVPGGWHAVAERRRRRRLAAVAAAAKTPAKPAAGLTGRDRLTLRMLAVAVIAVAPLIALDRGHVWAGLRHHATWFIPSGDDFDGGYARTMLVHVPADAETVVVMRDHPMRLIDRSFTQHGAAVFAIRGNAADSMAVLPKSSALRDALSSLQDFTGLSRWGTKLPPLTPTVRGDLVVLTHGPWGTVGAGPGDAITAELARAPGDAVIAIAMAPATIADDGLRRVSAWVSPTASGLVIGARLELTDAAKAEQLIADGKAAIASAVAAGADPHSAEPACSGAWAAIGKAVQLERAEAIVSVRLELTTEVAHTFARCMSGGRIK